MKNKKKEIELKMLVIDLSEYLFQYERTNNSKWLGLANEVAKDLRSLLGIGDEPEDEM